MTNTKKRGAFLITLFAAFMFAALALLGLTNFANAVDTQNEIVGIISVNPSISTEEFNVSKDEEHPTNVGTFGTAPSFKRPGLKSGTTQDKTGNTITIKLSLNGIEVGPAEGFNGAYNTYSNYINASMPAGVYTMQITAPATVEGGNNYAAVDETYYFEIAKKTSDVSVTTPPTASTAWCLEGSFANVFNDFESQMTAEKVTVSGAVAKADRTGFWATDDADGYFDSITDGHPDAIIQYQYKIGSMSDFSNPNNADMDVSNAWQTALASHLGGTDVDVNYQISLRNYVYTSTSTFALTINEEVAVPMLSDVAYTGNPVLPFIEGGKYTVRLNSADEYTAVGSHSVTFVLNGWTSSGRIRWAGSENNASETATASFNITKAPNRWVTLPSIVGWKWGNDANNNNKFEVNNITRGVPIGGTADDVLYSVYSGSSPVSVTIGSGASERTVTLANFKISATGEFLTASNAADSSIGTALQNLNAGSYTWRASVANDANENYDGITAEVRFTVVQTQNYWKEQLNSANPPYIGLPGVMSWEAGEFTNGDAAYTNRISGRPQYGAATLWVHPRSIAENNRTADNALLVINTPAIGTRTIHVNQQNIANLAGITTNIDRVGMANIVGGEYVLTARVAGTGNYTGLSQTVVFEVFTPIGQENHWTTVPNIQGWVVGSNPNPPIGQVAHGTISYSYRKEGDAIGSATDVVPTEVGNYIMVASTSNTEGYANLTAEVAFSIIGREYGWDVAPSIQGWFKGDAPNSPVGRVNGGTVTFTYKSAGNNMTTGSPDAPTEIGDYILIAVATKDGRTLRAEIPFSIKANPAGSVGGLTAGCIVLGVLLAACIGVALFFFFKMRQAKTVILKRKGNVSNLNELKRNAPKAESAGSSDRESIKEKLRRRRNENNDDE